MKERTTLAKAVWYLFLLLVVSMGSMKPFTIVFNQRLTPTDLIFPFVGVCLLGALLTGSVKLKFDRTAAAVILFVAAMAAAAIFSLDPVRSVGKLIGVIYLAGIALTAFHIVDSRERLKAIVIAFIAGSTISIIIGLITLVLFYVVPDSPFVSEFTYHFGAVPVGNYPRLSSTFVSASMFLNYLSVVMVMLIIARQKYSLSKVVFCPLLIALVICSAFTISIGLGAVFLILGIWFWSDAAALPVSVRRIALYTGIAAAAAFLLISPIALQPHATASPFFDTTFVGAPLYPSPRLLVWQEAIAKFYSDPLTGVGLGLPSAAVAFQNTDGSMSMLTDAHNVLLSIGSQTGLIGVLALIYICYTTLASSRSAADIVSNSAAGWLGIAFAIAFIYQGMTGSFEDARHLWLLIGLIPAAAAIERNAE